MAITLNHTIVPARDKEAAAKFFARIFGLEFDGESGHFVPVRVNDTLTLLFDEEPSFESHHYAFHVDDADFDAILGRVRQAGLAYGSAPWSLDDGKLNDWNGGRPCRNDHWTTATPSPAAMAKAHRRGISSC